MIKSLIAPLALLSVLTSCSVQPAFAADAPAPAECKNTLSTVIPMIEKNGAEYVLLPADKVQEFVDTIVEPMIGSGDITNVTNVLLVNFGGQIVFGLEFDDGCLTDPVAIPGAKAIPSAHA